MNNEDSEESVNDTYLEVWNSIPPKRPDSLKAFLGRLCRHISISRYRHNKARKRGGGIVSVCIDELSECIPAGLDLQRDVEAKALVEFLNQFLFSLSERDRMIFTVRYWYAMGTAEISRAFNINENTVKTVLRRVRLLLLNAMTQEGWK